MTWPNGSLEGVSTMLVIADANGNVGIGAAMEILRAGGCALDAVEAAVRLVESNPDDHSVGVGGYPNAAGEVELDASIMEGGERRAGAVGGLTGYAHPISVARRVMEKLPQHVLIVGQGAARFASDEGFEHSELLTAEAHQAWLDRRGALVDGASERSLADRQKTHGTVDFLAIDGVGRIASAVSTSGWAFKHPGRVGDSPIIGAGNYCDNRYGACACTGIGEWALRASTARTIVMAMQLGYALSAACEFAMRDLLTIPLPPEVEPVMSLVAIDCSGAHAAYSTVRDRTYIFQTENMVAYEERERQFVSM